MVLGLMAFFFVFNPTGIFHLLHLFFFISFFFGGTGTFDGFFFHDNLSFSMVLLTLSVMLVSICSMYHTVTQYFTMWWMMIFLFVCFTIDNVLLFYFFFEIVFILMFIYVMGWGKSMERFQASYYMLFYTMFFSLPLLVLLVDLGFSFSFSFFLLNFFFYDGFVLFFLVLVFIVKLPLFGFHFWLPKAHVEAPLSGSMILAGILLKLGGYGFLRFFPLLGFLNFSSSFFFSFMFYLSLLGGLFVSLLCFRQSDLKVLIAYSSVVHMSFMFLGLISFSFMGSYGSVLMMLGHGFVSPLMFYLMSYFYYMMGSRSMMILKGGYVFCSLFCFFWFVSCFLNLGFPPFLTFFSEIFISMGLGSFFLLDWFLLLLFFFFTGVYSVYLFVSVFHGENFFLGFSFSMRFKDYMLCFLLIYYVLLFPLFFLNIV